MNMKVFDIDHGCRPSFDSNFKEVTYYAKLKRLLFPRLLDKQGGDEITSTKEENKKKDADDKRRGAKNEVEEEEEYGIWSKLPMDLVIPILEEFSFSDYRNFRAVCRRWRSLGPALRWIPHHSKAIRYPWLVSFQIEDGIFNFYDPIFDFTYKMNTGASDPRILSSHGSWLLLAEGERSIYMLEPFRKMTIDLPLVPQRLNNDNAHVFAVDRTSTCYHFTRIYRSCASPEQLKFLEFSSKEGNWFDYVFNGESFLTSWNNLVIVRGRTWCLDQVGRLGSFRTVGWEVLNQSQKLSFPSNVWQNFLVPFKGELMSVFVGNSGGWVHVLEFNFSTRKWERVDSLGNLVLFVGRTSVAVEAGEKRLRNKIFFPVFNKADGNSIIFYSLESGRFHSFKSENSYLDFHDSNNFEIMSNCTWTQPGLIPTFR